MSSRPNQSRGVQRVPPKANVDTQPSTTLCTAPTTWGVYLPHRTSAALSTHDDVFFERYRGRPPSESDAVRQTFDGLRGGPLRPS